MTQAQSAQKTEPGSSNAIQARLESDAVVLTGELLNGEPAATVEMLDPADHVMGTAAAMKNRGVTTARIPIAKGEVDTPKFLWSRVRVSGGGKPRLFSLAAITAEIFVLRIAHPESAEAGRQLQVRVYAMNPVTKAPVRGVTITSTLSFDEGKELHARGRTNSAGEAVLQFQVPAGNTETEGELNVTGANQGFTREESIDIKLNRSFHMVVSTDKPIYQPGQQLHARALVFRTKKQALADTPFTFTLKDREGSVVLRETTSTNRFGIANVDWTLPEDAKLGIYQLETDYAGSEDFAYDQGIAPVRISRYELPQFTVTATPDKPYYLAKQDGDVEIRADYLFGKPMPGATVRVEREESRQWNYREQKWEIEKKEAYDAKTDADGRAKIHLDLKPLYADFADETYSRSRDITYAAYVTDPTTNRTEQRRFRVRLTRDPIHIYIARASIVDNKASFFVTAFYADGTPAQTQVRISRIEQIENGFTGQRFVTAVKTSRYGLARVEHFPLGQDDESATLLLEAHDAKGASVRHEEQLWTDHEAMRLQTTRVLHRPGESVDVDVTAPAGRSNIFIDISKDGVPIASRRIRLRNGHGSTSFTYQPDFSGELLISAYSLDLDQVPSRYDRLGTARVILFPLNTQLNVKLQPSKGQYRPGERASVAIRATATDGSAQESAIGLVVLDRAVEERAATDEEFASPRGYGFWDWNWWYRSDAFGGVTRADLEKLDNSEPFDRALDDVADLILNSYPYPNITVEGDDLGSTQQQEFANLIYRRLEGLRSALTAKGQRFPTTLSEFQQFARHNEITLGDLDDPWGIPFRYRFYARNGSDHIAIESAGPDQRFDTADDISARTIDHSYFDDIGAKIDRAVQEVYAQSGSYIRDIDVLRGVMRVRGVDLDALRNPFGFPYTFAVRFAGSSYYIEARTKELWDERKTPVEVIAWNSQRDYFERVRSALSESITRHSHNGGVFPQNDGEFDRAVADSGLRFRDLRDPWGHPYYVDFKHDSDYGDTIVIDYKDGDGTMQSTPVTRQVQFARVYSSGEDGIPGNRDDFRLAEFFQVVATQSAKDAVPKAENVREVPGATGAIRGTVIDPQGAVIANCAVTAVNTKDGQTFKATTASNGIFLLRDMPGGLYNVTFNSSGFLPTVIRDVPVHSSSVTTTNVSMRVASESTTVEVSAEAVQVQTTSQMVSSLKRIDGARAEVKEETFTPRLRQFFPETLLWQPSIVTDRGGRARVEFDVADSITSWKIAAVASTADGHVGFAETKIESFQPFFLDNDPPRVLTIGDEIALPAVLRNYTNSEQTLNVAANIAPWLQMLGPDRANAKVVAGGSTNTIFRFRAVAADANAKYQITAANRSTGDAVVKSLKVHPDGELHTHPAAAMLRDGDAKLSISIPNEAIASDRHAQLKIYPNLMAHVVESIEAGLVRPYGCGEQTISSTYPSLQYLRAAGAQVKGAERAKKYLLAGYQRLLNYRDEKSGGFTYWGRGDADEYLSAYALMFLEDAQQFISVDEDVLTALERYVLANAALPVDEIPTYQRGGAIYLIGALAHQDPAKMSQARKEALAKALAAFDDRVLAWNDPYSLAIFARAAQGVGDTQRANRALDRLRNSALVSGEGTYWDLQTNTAFYGWGLAGRTETTALAVRALASNGDHADQNLIDDGIRFLLAKKDGYGVWYSGQTTKNVLDAFLDVLKTQAPASTPARATILMNGSAVRTLELPVADLASAPMRVELSEYLRQGENNIEVRAEGAPFAQLQVVSSYYAPWQNADQRETRKPISNSALRLAVRYDQKKAAIATPVKCTVEAERIGHSGYGMMLAEIGLPPGAEVERKSLDEAMRSSDWGLSRYDVLPDRVVLYLWPRAGGTKLDFTFRVRYGIKAKGEASVLYDYYNPEAQTVVAPESFVIE